MESVLFNQVKKIVLLYDTKAELLLPVSLSWAKLSVTMGVEYVSVHPSQVGMDGLIVW